ncbi:MAG: FAD-binding protein [Legionellales bacterium]|nr:FAD-binding protein [Legionellales bacterium]
MEPLFIPTALYTPANHSYFPRYIASEKLIYKNSKERILNDIQNIAGSYIDGLELNVEFSLDNVPILHKGRKYICSKLHKWNVLYKIKSHEDGDLFSLEDIFKLLGTQKHIFIKVNSQCISCSEKASKIIELVNSYDMKDTIIVESFNPFFLLSMRQSDKDIVLMYNLTKNKINNDAEIENLIKEIPWLYKNSFFQKQMRRIIRPDLLGLYWNFSDKDIEYFVSHKYPIIYGTVHEHEEAIKLFKLGIKGVKTTNADNFSLKEHSRRKIYDAGGSRSQVYEIIHVNNINDIVKLVKKANAENKKISIAGRRHSMGGQSLLDESYHISMLKINDVIYNKKKNTVRIGAGATWKKVQNTLDKYGRSIKIMQSDNIFSVGGSISVNVHGWHPSSSPIGSTVVSMRVVDSKGKIINVSPRSNPKLFSAIIGGYGLFAIIYEIELITIPNSEVKFGAKFVNVDMLEKSWKEIVSSNENIELAYSRLSVDRKNLFSEAGIFYFEKQKDISQDKLTPESLISLKRAVFRSSEYINFGKRLRWKAEKMYAKKC